jgi:hypothetical protein
MMPAGAATSAHRQEENMNWSLWITINTLAMWWALWSPSWGTPSSSHGPADKATGGIGFVAAGLWAKASFNAHEARGNKPAKGVFNYVDLSPSGQVRFFKLHANAVRVQGKRAVFSGTVVASNVPAWSSRTVVVWVHDGGTPGRKGDLISIQIMPVGPNPNADAAAAAPMAWFPVRTGNLVVHTH